MESQQLRSLRRDAAWDDGMVDVKDGAGSDADGSDSEDSESGLNPHKATSATVDSSVLPGDTPVFS